MAAAPMNNIFAQRMQAGGTGGPPHMLPFGFRPPTPVGPAGPIAAPGMPLQPVGPAGPIMPPPWGGQPPQMSPVGPVAPPIDPRMMGPQPMNALRMRAGLA